jgi:hypothetical protein
MSENCPKNNYKRSIVHGKKVKEQQLLFTEESMLPAIMPLVSDLRPATNLSAVFEECHNYIYANEGLLKDKIFHEIVKLLTMNFMTSKTTQNADYSLVSLLTNIEMLLQIVQAILNYVSGTFSIPCEVDMALSFWMRL